VHRSATRTRERGENLKYFSLTGYRNMSVVGRVEPHRASEESSR